MTEQNIPQETSYRIRNFEDQLASVWQIGSGDFFAVKFDEDDEPTIYTQEQVANAFNDRYWERVSDDAVENAPVKEETLPRTFKFKVASSVLKGSPEIIYTYKETQEANNIFWGVSDAESIHYDVESIRKLIAEGSWIVLPSEPKIDTLQLKIEIDGIKEAKAVLDEMVEQSNTVLERIKSATQNYDMTISVDSGTYHIYDNLCDISYKAGTDGKLIEILDAIDFLSGCVDA